MMLIIGAGLLVRSFTTLTQVDPGFEKSNVAVMQVFAYGPPVATEGAEIQPLRALRSSH